MRACTATTCSYLETGWVDDRSWGLARGTDARRAEVVEFWRTVEMFSPQSVEKVSRERLAGVGNAISTSWPAICRTPNGQDRHAGRLGLYLSRQGGLITWSTEEFLRRLGTTTPLPRLRAKLREHLQAAAKNQRPDTEAGARRPISPDPSALRLARELLGGGDGGAEGSQRWAAITARHGNDEPAYVILDGKVDLWNSGKAHEHSGNVRGA